MTLQAFNVAHWRVVAPGKMAEMPSGRSPAGAAAAEMIPIK
jgi:hypothetical protein